MAEYRVPTQQELDRLLYMQGLQGKSNQQIIDENLARGSTIQALPENFFQTASAGARRVGDYVNQAGNVQQIVNKLFPSNIGNTQANVQIPTSFNFAPKQVPTGEILPAGLQTQSVPVASILQAIKPADVLGISGAERAYGDIGAGKTPQPMDVVDTLGVGAMGLGATGGLLKATKGLPVGMSIQEAKGLLQTAPKSDIGFYSAVEQAAMASPRKSATGQAFLNDIMKGQDVRADEIKWIGLDDYLKGKQNVTKQEVQDYIANNRVDVKEVRLGESVAEDPIGIAKRKAVFDKYEPEIQDLYKQLDSLGYGTSYRTSYDIENKLRYLQNKRDYEADAAYVVPEAIPTKFGQYTLPGGENYRELLLTMPTSEGSKLYRSSHFNQPNILAHLRVNDRIDADGKKMLLIEEVQSDWHQAGREQGYAKNVTDELNALKKRMSDFGEQRDPVTNRMINEQEWFDLANKRDELIKQSMGVPDAPFKDTWYQLALKRAIQHAAENGYDRIGLTTGSQQAARFDLSKQINELSYKKMDDKLTMSLGDGAYYEITALDKSGNRTIKKQVTEKELPDTVGKEMAKKIIANEGKDSGKNGIKSFSGLDLQVGGEGMKKYYDEIYPKFLDKYGKKWGAKIGETKVNTVMERAENSMVPQMGQEGVRYLDITPEMKAGVSKGQPLFAAVPAIPAAGLLAPQEKRR